MGVFGNPTGGAWAALVAAGVAMEAVEALRKAVETLGDDAHRALTIVLPHLAPATDMSSGNPDAPWDGP